MTRKKASNSRPVIALVAAAGKGTRLKASLPKAFVSLRGRSLVERSITALRTSGVVDKIIVLISPDMEDFARDLFTRRGLFDEGDLELVHGGGERADSVWAGLQAIDVEGGPIVLIHDAARALTPPGMIARVAREVLGGAPAVIPVLPVTDTIKSVDANLRVTGTPTRANLRAVQTPQGFSLGKLKEANRAYFSSETREFEATDDASLMEWFGVDVVCVDGDPMAFKVTTPLDLALATTVVDEAEPTVFEVKGG